MKTEPPRDATEKKEDVKKPANVVDSKLNLQSETKTQKIRPLKGSKAIKKNSKSLPYTNKGSVKAAQVSISTLKVR